MIHNIRLVIFDFDGVLTDNNVYVDSNGIESVRCNRSDGLGFKALKKLKVKSIICSTEANEVVLKRGEKLNIETFNGIDNKLTWIKDYVKDSKINPKNILYVGNDINDMSAMKYCGFSACPADSSKKIRKISDYVLKTKGGEGVVNEIVEKIFNYDLFELLYLEEKS